MATTNEIINAIKERYSFINPVIQIVTKNTVPMTGICMKVKGSNIAPVIYVDHLLNDNVSDADAAAAVMQIYHQSGIDIDLRIFQDKEYVLSHLYLGLQKKDNSVTFLHRNSDFEDIIEYMYVRDFLDGSNFSVKITQNLLNTLDISEELAWQTAQNHTSSEIEINTITEVISSMIPDESITEDIPIWVMSNSLKMHGAAVATNRDFIRNCAQNHGYDEIVVIFSSIHEALIIPATQADSLDDITNMINEVNESCVDPVEQLATKAYLIDCRNLC